RANLDGREAELTAVFPDFYPYTAFELYSSDLSPKRHHNPFTGNLCLIAGLTQNWSIRFTLADFIKNQLPAVLEAAETSDPRRVEVLEAHQAEPFSHFYRY